MALIITDDCTACDACVEPCPNDAISEGDGIIYLIDPERCTECVGHFDESQCQIYCPSDCIIQDVMNEETRDQLMAKYEALNG